MNIWQAMILGLVQGLAEFLPISSSGHLLFARALMNLPAENLLLDTFLHMGTLASIILVLRRDIADIFRNLFSKTTWLLLVATLPAVVATVLLGDFFDEVFGGKFLGISFLLTAAALLYVTFFGSRSREEGRPLYEMSYLQAVIMGFAQAIAILPGVSRSGFTLSGGLASGVNRDSAVRFAFLMAIPAIGGSFLLQVKDIVDMGWEAASGGMEILPLILGTIVACIMGFVALKWMLDWVRKGKLWIFAIYVAVLGLYTILDQYLFHILF